MGQVPEQPTASTRFLLIGDGKLARHFAFYLNELKLPYHQWSRRAEREKRCPSLVELAADSTHALLAVSDDAIERVILEYQALEGLVRVHFSGSLVTPLAYGVHPLMTFSESLLGAGEYPRIPLILEKDGPALEALLPGWPNRAFSIPAEGKAFYHALCVLSGNFTVLLWNKLFTELQSRFGLPKEVAHPYLARIASNLAGEESFPLTGPLARRDRKSIERNLEALRDDPFQRVYQAFVDAYGELSVTRASSPAPAEKEAVL